MNLPHLAQLSSLKKNELPNLRNQRKTVGLCTAAVMVTVTKNVCIKHNWQ